LEHSSILCHQTIITVEHLPPDLKDFAETKIIPYREKVLSDYQEILAALEKTGGNKSKAASLLGISVRTIYRKIENFKKNLITKPRYVTLL